MSLDLVTVEQTAFEGDFLKKAIPSKPIESTEELLEVRNEIRAEHDGAVTFPHGSLAIQDHTGWKPARDPITCWWHIHGRFDAMNEAGGSAIPSVLAEIPIMARAELQAALEVRQFVNAAPTNPPFEFPVSNLNDDIRLTAKMPLIAHIDAVVSVLKKAAKGDVDTGRVLVALNVFRMLWFLSQHISRGRFQMNFMRALGRSQQLIPKDKMLRLSPKDNAGYIIPPEIPHGRSVLEGKLTRQANQENRSLTIDRNTGEIYHPTGNRRVAFSIPQ